MTPRDSAWSQQPGADGKEATLEGKAGNAPELTKAATLLHRLCRIPLMKETAVKERPICSAVERDLTRRYKSQSRPLCLAVRRYKSQSRPLYLAVNLMSSAFRLHRSVVMERKR